MKIKPASLNGGVVMELEPDEAQLPTPAEGLPPEFSLKEILVPIDFSECSMKALRYAVPLARLSDATVTLLHIVEPYSPAPELAAVDADASLARVVRNGQEELNSLMSRMGAGVKFKTGLRVGTPALQIIKAASEMNSDMIILSTHGRTGVTRLILGSTAEKVVRQAGCPVLVVRETEHEFVNTLAES